MRYTSPLWRLHGLAGQLYLLCYIINGCEHLKSPAVVATRAVVVMLIICHVDHLFFVLA
jgi:hypothetical protein